MHHVTTQQTQATRRGALLRTGTFERFFDQSHGEAEPWYINDHCVARDRNGLWHLFGITHAEPLNPLDEKNLAHATSPSLAQRPWDKHPFALTADPAYDEHHLWAPFVVTHEDTYYMYVCVGARNNHRYKIHLFTSQDMFNWKRHAENPMVVDGFDARDPCILRLDGEWLMYYTATIEPAGGNHIVACRRSKDLVHWGERSVVFVDEETGTFGGSTESPCVVRRGDVFYLFICNNDRRSGYDATDVFASRNPLHWTMEDRVATLNAHAAEVIRDVDGKWYITHCGWGRGGAYIAPLYWNDGLADEAG